MNLPEETVTIQDVQTFLDSWNRTLTAIERRDFVWVGHEEAIRESPTDVVKDLASTLGVSNERATSVATSHSREALKQWLEPTKGASTQGFELHEQSDLWHVNHIGPDSYKSPNWSDEINRVVDAIERQKHRVLTHARLIEPPPSVVGLSDFWFPLARRIRHAGD